MVDWQSPAELAIDASIFNNFMHALIGLYAWEFFTSLGFDWDFVSGRKKFRWPLIFYFAGRYILLAALIGILISLNVRSEVNCQALYTFIQFAGDAAVGFASINLALRTLAIYKDNQKLVYFIVVIILGHWALIFSGISLTAVYVPGMGCAITKTKSNMILAVFVYSVTFDTIVLCLSAYKLALPWRGRSQIVKLIFADGLIYFAIALVANTIAMAFMVLNLNAVMSVIFNVPAVIASTIVASRVVRRLANYTSAGAEVFSSGHIPSSGGVRSRGGGRMPTLATKSAQLEGVHVKMETFTVGGASVSMQDGDGDGDGDLGFKPRALDPEADPAGARDYKGAHRDF